MNNKIKKLEEIELKNEADELVYQTERLYVNMVINPESQNTIESK